MALLGTDRLLSDFGLDLRAKRQTMERLRDSFQRQFQTGVLFNQQMGERFRMERKKLIQLLEDPADCGPFFESAASTLEARSALIRTVVAALRASETAGTLTVPLNDLTTSYVHMHINRMIRSSAKEHELVIYNLLYRLYDGKLARRPG
jgi:lantibiotic biosynthesis protein